MNLSHQFKNISPNIYNLDKSSQVTKNPFNI